jgi:iron-only hydrogenase group A
MLFTVLVNNRKIKAEKGETILSALNRNGIIIPTLCRMKDFTPSGACRMCVVEVEGHERLVTACSQPIEEWMKIKTHSPRVITARKTIVELLLSNHPDNCLYCHRNFHCELQRLAGELNINERRIHARKIRPRLDQSSPAIVRELSKCILCGRCVRVCGETVTANTLDFIKKGKDTHVGTAMDKDFNFSSCIHCGQCLLVCPTGALHEKHTISEVQEYLNKPEFLRAIQYSSMVVYGIAEELGMKYTRDFDRVLNSILRKIGFDRIYKTGTGTDICITEITDQVYEKINRGDDSPLYLSACPAWVKYVEQFLPSLIPFLSKVKSPQQITGALIKTIVADQLEIIPEEIYSVAVTSCVAMKYEARRDGMTRKGLSDVDSVLTVRELAMLIRLYGIDTTNIDPEPADDPLTGRSSAAILSEVSGGLAEGVLRSLFFSLMKKEPDKLIFKKLRSTGSFRELTMPAGDTEIRAAVVDGLTGLEKLRSSLAAGNKYHVIEVMACQGGCVHGAGLNFSPSKDEIKNRAKLVYQSDETEAITLPVKSPACINIYEKFLKENKETDKKIFYTHFEQRNVLQ